MGFEGVLRERVDNVETVNADVNLMSLAFNICLCAEGYCGGRQISQNTNDQQIQNVIINVV